MNLMEYEKYVQVTSRKQERGNRNEKQETNKK